MPIHGASRATALFIALFTLSAAARAETGEGPVTSPSQVDDCDHPSPLPKELVDALDRIRDRIGWWSATEDQISQAPCRAGVPTNIEMREWLDARLADPAAERATRTIHGITLENQPVELLDLFEELTTTRRYDGSDQASFTVPAGCRDFDCATQAIFPGGRALPIVYLAGKHGFNASEFAGLQSTGRTNSDPLTREELDDILAGAADIPAPVARALERPSIQHFSRGYTLASDPDGTVLANARISLFDSWSWEGRPRRQYTILHEIAHRTGDSLSLDSSERWLRIGGWREVRDGEGRSSWVTDKPEELISHYAGTNPDEDWAETVAAYRYNPALLREVSPEKYAMVRDLVFDGVEYTSAEACTDARPAALARRDAAHTRAAQTYVGINWTDRLARSGALRMCREEIFRHFGNNGLAASTMPAPLARCVSDALVTSSLDTAGLDPDYVRVLERTRALQGGAELFPAERAQLLAAMRRQLREGIEETVTRPIFGDDDFYLRIAIRERHTPAQFCETASQYAYQKADALRIDFDPSAPSGSYSTFMYGQRDLITTWSKGVCLSIFGNAPTVTRPTQAQVRRAIDRAFAPAGPAPSAPPALADTQ